MHKQPAHSAQKKQSRADQVCSLLRNRVLALKDVSLNPTTTRTASLSTVRLRRNGLASSVIPRSGWTLCVRPRVGLLSGRTVPDTEEKAGILSIQSRSSRCALKRTRSHSRPRFRPLHRYYTLARQIRPSRFEPADPASTCNLRSSSQASTLRPVPLAAFAAPLTCRVRRCSARLAGSDRFAAWCPWAQRMRFLKPRCARCRHSIQVPASELSCA